MGISSCKKNGMNLSALRNAVIEALTQMSSLVVVAQKASNPTANVYADSGVGRHVRHVADHFRAFESGIVTGTIDYNERRRESELEQCANLGLAEIQEIRENLKFVQASFQTVSVESEISCIQRDSRLCESTFDRELMYLINHTIHHVAYASLLLQQFGLTPDASLGYAPATATFLRQNGAHTE